MDGVKKTIYYFILLSFVILGLTGASLVFPTRVWAAPVGANTTVCTGAVSITQTTVTLNWAVYGRPQIAFRLQVDDNSNFSSPLVDTGQVNSGQKSYSISRPGPGSYYWRIRVRSSASGGSYWTPWAYADSPFNIFGFSLSNSGNITVIQGQSGSNTIAVNLTNPPTQAVSLSISGLPSGASANFSPSSCNPTCYSTLTISAAGTTPTGSYTITVTGTGGVLTRTTSFTLTIQVATHLECVDRECLLVEGFGDDLCTIEPNSCLPTWQWWEVKP